MSVPILKQGTYLIASIQSAMTDSEALSLQDDLMDQVSRYRSRGIIVDVTALDVMDSFTVIVGIQAEVAFAMVQLGMSLEDVHTALDLEEGLAFLDQRTRMWGGDGRGG